MEQSNEEKLVRHCKDKDMDKAVGGAIMLWMLSGAILSFATGWMWMFTWWGFFFVGLPYGALLVYVEVRAVDQKYKQGKLGII